MCQVMRLTPARLCCVVLGIAGALGACKPNEGGRRGPDPNVPDPPLIALRRVDTLQSAFKLAQESTKAAIKGVEDSARAAIGRERDSTRAAIQRERDSTRAAIKISQDSAARAAAAQAATAQRRLDSLARHSERQLDSLRRQIAAAADADRAQKALLQRHVDSLAGDARRRIDSVGRQKNATPTAGPSAAPSRTEVRHYSPPADPPSRRRTEDWPNSTPPDPLSRKRTALQHLYDGLAADWSSAADMLRTDSMYGFSRAGERYRMALANITAFERLNGADQSTRMLRSETNRRLLYLVAVCESSNRVRESWGRADLPCPRPPAR
jgi:hypothetical protein